MGSSNWGKIHLQLITDTEMKNFRYFILFIGTLAFLAGCNEDELATLPTPSPIKAAYTATSSIRVVHAVPGALTGNQEAPNVKIRYNNVDTNISNLAFGSASSYVAVSAVPQGQVRAVTAAEPNSNVASISINHVANTSYTYFVVDSLTRAAGRRMIRLQDNLAAPGGGNAHIRFFHASPNAPAVWVSVGAVNYADRRYLATGAPGATGAAATAYQNFTPITAGTYSIVVRTGSADGPIVLQVDDVELASGKIYTLFAKGFVGGANALALGAGLVLHN
jgi:hypothetical protein